MKSENQNIYSLRLFFDGSDYPYWKFKMELYLDCDSINLWDIIQKGWEPPKSIINGVETEIDRDDWNVTQQEANHKNKKGMITLVSYMSREGVKIQHCISAKEMWETLENHYEGNIQVRSKTSDESSESEMEEEQQEPSNLCFMALEDDNEVPSTSNSSFYDFEDD